MSLHNEPLEEKNSFCTFWVEGLYFGIEVSRVQEVIREQITTVVPLAPNVVNGLMNLRGQIVTALDLRHRFGLPVVKEGQSQMNVVIRTPEGPVSLMVDKIGDVATVDPDDFEQAPETLDESIKALIHGAFKLDDQLLLIINAESAICVPA